jgi:hypothetical protein
MPFIKSDLSENIYYADLFQIGKNIWMIMGYGKSDAARIASNRDSSCDYSRDCVAISTVNSELFGRFDPGAINTEIDQSLFTQRKVDIVAYCLSPEQTQKIYIELKRDFEIIEINNELMSQLSVIYPWSAWAASDKLYSREELAYLRDPERRMQKFKSVTDEVKNVKFVILPFMNAVEEKAAMYTNYSAH